MRKYLYVFYLFASYLNNLFNPANHTAKIPFN
jgi:hypothetical protein